MVICVFTCIFNNTNLWNHSLLNMGSFARYLLVVLFNPLIIYLKDQPVQDNIRTIVCRSF
jgi:hypothetical protein